MMAKYRIMALPANKKQGGEHLLHMIDGGSPSDLWYQYTGTPWSQAKARGLTDGSAQQNLALVKRIKAGEFGRPKGGLSTTNAKNSRATVSGPMANNFFNSKNSTSNLKKTSDPKKPSIWGPLGDMVADAYEGSTFQKYVDAGTNAISNKVDDLLISADAPKMIAQGQIRHNNYLDWQNDPNNMMRKDKRTYDNFIRENPTGEYNGIRIKSIKDLNIKPKTGLDGNDLISYLLPTGMGASAVNLGKTLMQGLNKNIANIPNLTLNNISKLISGSGAAASLYSGKGNEAIQNIAADPFSTDSWKNNIGQISKDVSDVFSPSSYANIKKARNIITAANATNKEANNKGYTAENSFNVVKSLFPDYKPFAHANTIKKVSGQTIDSFGLNDKQQGGSIELELSDDEINDYISQGYIVEEIDNLQRGGTPSQLWYQYTGTPWSEAKSKKLTDGSMEQNLALAKRLQAGEFGEPKLSNEQYENRRSGYNKRVEQMVNQGKTLDQLVKQRIGTREGLKTRFPELFNNESKVTKLSTDKAKSLRATVSGPMAGKFFNEVNVKKVTPEVKKVTPSKKTEAELKASRDWLTQKVKEIGIEMFDAIEDSYIVKLAKKAGKATVKFIEAEEAKDKLAKNKAAKDKAAIVTKEKIKKEKATKEIINIENNWKNVITTLKNKADVLENAGLDYKSSPMESLKKFTTEDYKKSDMDLIYNQVMSSKSVAPRKSTVNETTPNFADRAIDVDKRNKALSIKPLYMPEEKSMVNKAGELGSELWNDAKETASQTWEGTKDLAEEYIADPINETIFGTKDFPTSIEEFIETTPGKWLGNKAYESGLLPKDKEDQLKRKLEKLGEIPIIEEVVKIDPNKKTKKIVVKENAPVDEFTEEIGSSGDGQYLSYRNQWDNKKGFEYITTRDNYDRPDDESYDDVIGVGHYLLDAYIYGDNKYSHKNNTGFLRKAKENDDWIPAFKKTSNNKVLLIYKKPSELTDKDIVVSPLRQYKFSSINFNDPISSSSLGYSSNAGIKHLTTKEGDEFKVTFSNPDLYGRHSGASVVFIFKDKFNNTIVRDFAGSLNQIKEEGQQIINDYNLKDADLTIGYHDVASYGAKPKANSSGKLKGSTWKNWNNEPHTGGALIIPIRKNQINSKKRYRAQVKSPNPFK